MEGNTGVMCDRNIPTKFKDNAYTLVRAIKLAMIYGVYCWAVRKKERKWHTTEMHMLRFIHIVSPTALIHRTARSPIPAISSLFGLSPKCRQFVIMWPRSHLAAPHTRFALPVAPQMFCCRGGSLSRAHSVGRPGRTRLAVRHVRHGGCGGHACTRWQNSSERRG